MTDAQSRIAIRPAANRWRVRFEGHVIADSADALILEEPGHRPVVYFPREDVAMEYMSRTARTSHCPMKGEASYYTLLMDGDFAENAVWSYEDPVPGAEAIACLLAFYPDKAEIYEVSDAEVNPRGHAARRVDEVVRHTDSGSGASQADPWPSNVEPNAPGW